MSIFRIIDNPLCILADRARKSYFARADFQAAHRLFELDPTPITEIAFLKARAALRAVIESGT